MLDTYTRSGGSGGGGRGFKAPSEVVFFACQYMKIPADLDPTPLEEFRSRTSPPPEEFLDPPLTREGPMHDGPDHGLLFTKIDFI